jgi:anti-anti-sigma regulatory factor
MDPPLSWTSDDDDGHTVISVRGTLSRQNVSGLRTALLKCLAEQPSALVVELSGMSIGDPLALTVFMAVGRQAATWPGISLILCAPTPAVAELLANGGFGTMQVVGERAEAAERLAAGDHGPQTVSDVLLPVRGAARHARNVVTDACLRWSLPHLVGPASVLAGELVANVIDHAGTMMTLRVSLRRRHLHVALWDGSAEPPAPLSPPFRPGSGLSLIDATATHWGWMPASGGKVVWAVLGRF